MIRYVLLALAALFLCAASLPHTINVQSAGDPTSGVLPSYNDAYANWTNAGLQPVGGIPNRTTVCSTVSPSGKTPPTTGDDASLINAAIRACPSGEVVMLAAGTFQLDMSETIKLGNSVTLRGSGTCNNSGSPYCSSVINVYNGLLAWTGGKCGVSTSAEVACQNVPEVLVAPLAASNQFDFGWSGNAILHSAIGFGTEVDADAAQGQTTIQVHSTTHFSVGAWVLIDEASGATWQNDPVGPNLYGQVWAAPDFLSASGNPATGRVQWSKYGNGTGDMGSDAYPYTSPGTIQSYYDRATSEIHLIKAVGAGPCPGVNCTITFDDPLMIAYRKSGAGIFTGAISRTTLTTTGDPCTLTVAQIVSDPSTADNVTDGTYVTAVNSCSNGVGNYTVNKSQTVASETMIFGAHQAHIYYPTHASTNALPFLQNAGLESVTVARAIGGGVNFEFCAYCWTKDVEVVGWAGGGVNFTYAVRNQMDTTFVNNCGNSVNNGAEYPIGVQDGSTEVYIVNSITRLCGKGMVGKAAAGTVVAYNYMDDTMYDSFSGIGDYWLDMGINGSHWTGTHHFLFEGNWGNNLDNDDTHGNQVYHTYFRNWGTGLRSPFTDPSIPGTVNDATRAAFYCGTTGPSGCRTNAPSVLHAFGPMMHNYWDAFVGNVFGTAGVTTTANGWRYSGTYANGNKMLWMPGWNADASHPSDSDPNLNTSGVAYIFKHGNYDYVDGAIADWTAGYSQTLPNSFYLAGPPSFFAATANCTYPWPWVTPTAAAQIQSPSGGSCKADTALPSKARFDAGTPFVQP